MFFVLLTQEKRLDSGSTNVNSNSFSMHAKIEKMCAQLIILRKRKSFIHFDHFIISQSIFSQSQKKPSKHSLYFSPLTTNILFRQVKIHVQFIGISNILTKTSSAKLFCYQTRQENCLLGANNLSSKIFTDYLLSMKFGVTFF